MAKRKEIKTVSSILNGVERLFLQALIGLIAPVVGLLAGWWGSIPFVPEASIKYFALGGLLAGVFIDMLFLHRWVRKAYELPVTGFVLVYLFYSACLLGFFMGVPVFNFFLGIIAGYYVGLCLRHKDADRPAVDKTAHKASLFTAAMMAVVCVISLTIAYLDASLSANIQGLFNLENAISKPLILTYSSLGGILLVVLEYFITHATVKFARFM
jgi:hypothetical protein